MTLEIVPAYDRKKEIKELFAEYTDMLVKTDPVFAKYLAIQGYDDELKDMGRKTGRLYRLAQADRRKLRDEAAVCASCFSGTWYRPRPG